MQHVPCLHFYLLTWFSTSLTHQKKNKWTTWKRRSAFFFPEVGEDLTTNTRCKMSVLSGFWALTTVATPASTFSAWTNVSDGWPHVSDRNLKAFDANQRTVIILLRWSAIYHLQCVVCKQLGTRRENPTREVSSETCMQRTRKCRNYSFPRHEGDGHFLLFLQPLYVVNSEQWKSRWSMQFVEAQNKKACVREHGRVLAGVKDQEKFRDHAQLIINTARCVQIRPQINCFSLSIAFHSTKYSTSLSAHPPSQSRHSRQLVPEGTENNQSQQTRAEETRALISVEAVRWCSGKGKGSVQQRRRGDSQIGRCSTFSRAAWKRKTFFAKAKGWPILFFVFVFFLSFSFFYHLLKATTRFLRR